MSNSTVEQQETIEHIEGADRVSTGEAGTEHTRRKFLAALGSGVAATVGVSGTVDAREAPTISMGNNYFDPPGLAVEPGTTVRFEVDAGSHSATAYADRIPSGATPFDSGTISEGVFEHTFDAPGTYDYYCIPHQRMGMTGRVVVGEPGGPAEATPIPDGDVPDSDAIVTQGSIGIDEFEGSGKDTDGEMMESRPGMMDWGGHGWGVLVPIGFFSTALGLSGGAIYWASRRQTPETGRENPAIATLRDQYARGDVDEEEFERRFERLKREE